ncbi:MAG: tRNA (5-methylaminomethyl-2-thiouridine)(34)-methyltransferase MnmD [Tannerellaceae bacterium]|nr:tRNA (5-methylaminomethyl-2-thiouridine)(34)-methyltransferase MnmD [Tannerellaceae bacterium]MCD8263788.1 tRNA (5-methylaminomethyl-2-thiouridine)(34)-methyltransferase MnmD [Tannerellaceae bacterium]
MQQNTFKREIELTLDGSHTLYVPEMDEHYHSVNGAIQEAMHVYIGAGLDQIKKESVRVLEIGFGTGLNCWLTLLESENRRQITYYSYELYPLNPELIAQLNYTQALNRENPELFAQLHIAAWDTAVTITDHFILNKINGDSSSGSLPEQIDVIYYDAFAPEKQPEMWREEIFERLFACTAPGGVLTTYCAKGTVRRMMQKAGYSVERIPGPPGKREMLRATKPV